MRFYVTRKEVHDAIICVEAESKEDAINRVKNGEGDEVATEYNRTLDPDTWTVEEAANQ